MEYDLGKVIFQLDGMDRFRIYYIYFYVPMSAAQQDCIALVV